MINRRIEDLQRAYSTTDPDQAYRILRKYDVQYLVVGGLERAYYPAGQAKWQLREGRYWTVAYENPGVRIYRLIEPSLAQAGRSS
jgi:uncharacterized membrane protein